MRRYKCCMHSMSGFSGKKLPRPIPAEQLQMMLGAGGAFRSWSASHPTIPEMTAGWPFLFAQPLMGYGPKMLRTDHKAGAQ
jgi:hypothetical protein